MTHILSYQTPMFWIDFQGPAIWKIVGLLIKENGDRCQTFPIFADGWIGAEDFNGEEFCGVVESRFVKGTYYYDKFREAFMKSVSNSEENFLKYCAGKGIEIVSKSFLLIENQ